MSPLSYRTALRRIGVPAAGRTSNERQQGQHHHRRGQTTVDSDVRWRVGNRNARNVYLVTPTGEFHAGVMFTESLGRYVVSYLNERGAVDPPEPADDIGPAVPEVT